MSKYIFLYKDNSEDRDCCAYIESKPLRFECNHYFGGVNLHGACYCGKNFDDYENIRTILTKEEYERLINFDKEIDNLGYGINKGDDRYKLGLKLCEDIQPIYDKLLSFENEEFFEEIQKEEIEFLMNEYNLDEEDIERIFNEYYLDYRDRGIVGYVFKDEYDLGYEEAWSIGYIRNNDSIMERYFDYEKFGEDLLEEERYVQLRDNRVVSLNY